MRAELQFRQTISIFHRTDHQSGGNSLAAAINPSRPVVGQLSQPQLLGCGVRECRNAQTEMQSMQSLLITLGVAISTSSARLEFAQLYPASISHVSLYIGSSARACIPPIGWRPLTEFAAHESR